MSSTIMPQGPNFKLLSATITVLQKFAFVLYVGISLYNGTIFNFFNQYLTPAKATSSWLKFFSNKNLDECKSMLNILLSHSCINALLVTDDADVVRAVSDMSPFSKWHYLTIVRSCKALAPYIFQTSMLLILFLLGIILIAITKNVLQAFGINTPWEQAKLSFLGHISSVIGINQLAVIPGFGFVSGICCLINTGDCNKGCPVSENPFGLYCITSLYKTIFSDLCKAENDISSDSTISFVCSISSVLASYILIVLIYYFTIFFVCLNIYIVMDAVYNFWEAGTAIMDNITSSSPRIIHSTWNQYIPITFRELCFQLVQMNKNGQQIQRDC